MKFEFKKIFGMKWLAVFLAAMLFVSVLLCVLTALSGEREKFTADEIKEIKAFVKMYSDDPDGLAEFERSRQSALLEKMQQVSEEYEKELAAGADVEKLDEKYMKIYEDESQWNTYVFSEKIDDITLKAAFEKLNGIRDKFQSGVEQIRMQATDNAAHLRTEYGMTPSDPLYQYQIYVYNKYSAVEKKAVVGEEFSTGWDKLFAYASGDVFLFVAVMVAVCALYSVDRQSRMTPIIRTTKRGRIPFASVKLGTALLLTLCMTLIYAAAIFAAVGAVCGYSDASASVQNVQGLELFAENATIWQFAVYTLGMKILSALAFAALLSAICSLIRLSVLDFLAGAVLICGMFFAGLPANSGFPLFNSLNLLSVCHVLPITEKLKILQLGLGCTGYHLLAPSVCAVTAVISSALVIFAFSSLRETGKSSRIKARVAGILSESKKRRAEKALRTEKSFMGWEFKKLISQSAVPFLLVALVILQVGVSFAERRLSEPSREERIFERYILSEASGKFSENKDSAKALIDIYTDAENGGIKLEKYVENGLFAEDSAKRISENIRFINDNDLNDEFDYADEVYLRNEKLFADGFDPEFIDEAKIAPLVTDTGSYPLWAAIIIISIFIWMSEYGGKSREENFAFILRSTANGRKPTFWTKTVLSAASAAVLSTVFYGCRIWILYRTREGFSAPLCSVCEYANSGIDMTVSEYMVLMLVGRIAAAVMLALFAAAVSALIKKLIASFAIVFGCTVLPTVAASEIKAVAGCSFGDFFGANEMIIYSAKNMLFGSKFGNYILFAVVFCVLAAALTVSAALKYGKEKN